MAADNQILKRAQEMFEKGQFDYAISLFKQALLRDLNEEKAHRGLALAAQKKLQASGGISGFKSKMMSAKTTTHLKAVAKNVDKRVEVAMNHLAGDPNSEKIRIEFAQACAQKGALNGAIVEAELATQINPNSPDALKSFGLFLTKRGNPDDIMRAQKCLERTVQLKPEDREANKLLRDLAALSSMTRSGIETAKDFRDIIKDKGQTAKLEKKQRIIRTDEEFESELEDLKKEFQENPKDARIPKKIGDLYTDRKKNFEVAGKWYQKAVEVNPQDSTLKDKVDDSKVRLIDIQILKMKKAKDPKEKEFRTQKLKFEIASFERRARDRPTDPTVKFELGKRYLQAGPNFIDKAVGQFQQSVKDPKMKVDSHTYLGLCFQNKKMYDLADQQYESAENAGFVTPDRQKAIWYQRAKCKKEAGDTDGAITLCKRIMAEDIGYKDISKLVENWTKELTEQK